MNPSSDISLKKQFAKTLDIINELVDKKDYKAVFEKLFNLSLFEPDSEISIYQRQKISLEILIITKIIFDKILHNDAGNFVFFEDNLVEKFNQVIKFFKSQGISQQDLDDFSISCNLLTQLVSDVVKNKKRPKKKFNKKTIPQISFKGLFISYLIFLLKPPTYLKPYLKNDLKKYLAKSLKKSPQNLPLLLPADKTLVPKLPSILLGHSNYQFDYLSLRKLIIETFATQNPLSLRSPIKLLKISDSNFLKSSQLFDFFAKMACDSDKKIQFKFYKSLIINENLSKTFLRFLYHPINKTTDSQSLVELAIANNNVEFFKTALKFGFKPELFVTQIGDQLLSAKALAIRNSDVETFKVLFGNQTTKIPSQTEFSGKNSVDRISSFNDLELAFVYERFDILKYLSQSHQISQHKISISSSDHHDIDPFFDEDLLPRQKGLKPFKFYDHQRKIFLDFEDYFNNFLAYAVITNDLTMLKILIIDFEEIIKDEYKINALYYAIRLNRAEMIGIIVQKKISDYIEQNSQKGLPDGLELIVNIDDQLPCQLTPLQLSVLYSSYESMQILLDLGSKASQISANEESALSLAIKLRDIDALEILKYNKVGQISTINDSESNKIRQELIHSLTSNLDPIKIQLTKSKLKSLMFSQQYKHQNITEYFYLKTQCRIMSYDLIANSFFKSFENYNKTFKSKEIIAYNNFLKENLLMLLTSIRLASTKFPKKIEHQEMAKSYFKRSTNFNFYCLLTLATDFKPKAQKKFVDNDYTIFLFIDLVASKLCNYRLKNFNPQHLSFSNPFAINHKKFQANKESLGIHFRSKFDDWLDRFHHYLAIDQELSDGRPICEKIKSKFYQENDRIIICALRDLFKIAINLERFEIDLPKTPISSGLSHFNNNPSDLKQLNEQVDKLCESIIYPFQYNKPSSQTRPRLGIETKPLSPIESGMAI